MDASSSQRVRMMAASWSGRSHPSSSLADCLSIVLHHNTIHSSFRHFYLSAHSLLVFLHGAGCAATRDACQVERGCTDCMLCKTDVFAKCMHCHMPPCAAFFDGYIPTKEKLNKGGPVSPPLHCHMAHCRLEASLRARPTFQPVSPLCLCRTTIHLMSSHCPTNLKGFRTLGDRLCWSSLLRTAAP